MNDIEDFYKVKEFIKAIMEINPKNKKEYDNGIIKIRRELKYMPSKSLLSINYQKMLNNNEISQNKIIEKFIRNKSVRSNSGVLVVTLVMKPDKFSCPYDCYMCPDERIENGADVDMPRSYLSSEPAEMRAAEVNFQTIKQFNSRMKTHKENNHELDKIEIIVLGGTFSTYPRKYQEEFIRDTFYAANVYSNNEKRKPLSLIEEQSINESSSCHIVGLSIETRPDQINNDEIKRLRKYGVTRVQMGIQHTNDKFLKIINRQHTVKHSINAIKKLKNVGFKIELHIMPDLPEATPEDDIKMMNDVFNSDRFQPDYIKIYPCLDVKYTKIREWKKSGIWKPYAEKGKGEELFKVLLYALEQIPYWTRDSRVQRDFPLEHKNNNFIGFNSDNIKTNLYQLLLNKLKSNGKKCKSIRNREIKGESIDINDINLYIDKYRASEGDEYFISYENKNRNVLYGFVRLRFNDNHNNIFSELKNSALIRELHVYGSIIPVNSKNNLNAQHYGFGKKLMKQAEIISSNKGYTKIAVISSIGTRNYYRKIGYKLEGTYMTKKIIPYKKKILLLLLFCIFIILYIYYIIYLFICICRLYKYLKIIQ